MRNTISTCLTIAAASFAIVGCGSVPPQTAVNTPTLLAPAVAPTYPLAARQLGEQGTTVLRVTVDAIGRVSAASVVTTSGSPRLDTAALEAVQKWRYTPAVRNGLPVATELDVPVTFAMAGDALIKDSVAGVPDPTGPGLRRPERVTHANVRLKEPAFRDYVDNWVKRVQAVGTAHYTEAARDNVYGRVQVTTRIRPNGQLAGVQIDRSSGVEAIDRAVMRIVERASPFAPLPATVRVDTDILEITRTWAFEPPGAAAQ